MKQAIENIVTSVPPFVLFMAGLVAALGYGAVRLLDVIEAARQVAQ